MEIIRKIKRNGFKDSFLNEMTQNGQNETDAKLIWN